MSESKLAVGESVESVCTKCRETTRHIIVSLVGETPAKVECTVCEGVHNFRTPKPARVGTRTRASRKPKTASPRAAGASAQKEWAEVARNMDPARAVPYAMTGLFSPNDWVKHPAFGLGLVKKTIRPNKMEVLFEQGVKLLRCCM